MHASGWRWALLGIALLALAGAAPANAARLPKPKEAKGLRHAFAHDKRHPKRAVIVGLKVSTVNRHWGRVSWTLPKKPASAPQPARAKAKIINFHNSDYDGLPKHPKPADPPPKAVKDDWQKALRLELTYTAHGEEDGVEPTQVVTGDVDNCGQDDTVTISHNWSAPFSWTETFVIRVDRPTDAFDEGGQVVALGYAARSIQQTNGTLDDTDNFSQTSSTNCAYDNPEQVTCRGHERIVGPSNFTAVFDERGFLLYPFFAQPLSPGQCDDGTFLDYNYGSGANRRWAYATQNGQLANLVAGIPLNFSGLPGSSYNVADSYNVSFPKSVPDHDGPAQSYNLGYCSYNAEANPDVCSDNLSWSGTVDVKILGG